MNHGPGCILRGAWDGSCCLWIDGFPGPLTQMDSSSSPPSPSSQRYEVPHLPHCSGNLDHCCCNTSHGTCKPGALPSPHPDCRAVVYASDKRTSQEFPPIWFIFHLKNRESLCIFLIHYPPPPPGMGQCSSTSLLWAVQNTLQCYLETWCGRSCLKGVLPKCS